MVQLFVQTKATKLLLIRKLKQFYIPKADMNLFSFIIKCKTCNKTIVTSPMLDCRMTSMEAASMLPASAFMWTPLGAFRLSERVGDSSLRRNTTP